MENAERSAALETLTKQWGTYVTTFHRFSDAQKAEFLERQGYQRFSDLLAHIVAWWELGMKSIQRCRSEPDYQDPNVDVDPFNAAAVEKAKGVEEEDMIRTFERARADFQELVTALSDEDWKNSKILGRVQIELSGHYQEHAIE